MLEKPDVKIFVSHRNDLDSFIIKNDVFFPVVSGAADDKRSHVEIQGDNTGDNISDKARKFNELTVQYWAWKNVKADYYGLCHYRRYMSFSDKKFEEDIYGNVPCKYLNEETAHLYGLDNVDKIKEIVAQNDLIYTNFDVSKLGFKNLYEQFKSVPYLDIKSLETAIDVLREKYPEFVPVAEKYFQGTNFYPCEMYVMKKELFEAYNKWLFDILSTLEQRIDFENRSVDSIRILGHIAERLDGVYFSWLINNPDIRSKCLQRVLFANTEKLVPPAPYYEKNNLPILLCSSNFYVPYLSCELASIMENASSRYNYDVLILTSDITKRNQELLKRDLSRFDNMHIRFLDVSQYVYKLNLHGFAHIAKETYYRLLVPELLSKYDKVVYLDGDVIVKGDISQFYETDLGDNLLAAVIDADHAGEYQGAVPVVKPFCDAKLKLKDPFSYFQAGVLVFNIDQLRASFKPGELIRFASEHQDFIYGDQDILNALCKGRVKYVDMAWNVEHDCGGFRVNKIIRQAPVRIYDKYMESRKNPKIVHYAGFEKPWDNPECDYAEEFWPYARKSLFYEIILRRMVYIPAPPVQQKDVLRRLADKMLPVGSRRRKLAKKIVPRNSPQWKLLRKIYHLLKF